MPESWNEQGQNKTDEDDNCGSDWVSYSETKCFAVLDKQGNIEEAEAEWY